MIRLTRLNHGPFLVNPDLIEHVEITPDTVVSLSTGAKFLVLESADEIAARILEYRRAICRGSGPCSGHETAGECEHGKPR